MKELTREEMMETNGGFNWKGFTGRFLRNSNTVYAPGERDAVGEAKRLKEKDRKKLFDNLSKADSRDRADRARDRRYDREKRHAGDSGRDNR